MIENTNKNKYSANGSVLDNYDILDNYDVLRRYEYDNFGHQTPNIQRESTNVTVDVNKTAEDVNKVFKSMQDKDGNLSPNIRENIGRYAVEQTEQEENTFYENKQRMDKVVNIASIAMTDHTLYEDADKYDNLLMGSLSTTLSADYIEMGIGSTEARERANALLTDSMVKVTTATGHEQIMHISGINGGGFSQDEVQSLFDSGIAMRTSSNGATEKYEIISFFEDEVKYNQVDMTKAEAVKQGIISSEYNPIYKGSATHSNIKNVEFIKDEKNGGNIIRVTTAQKTGNKISTDVNSEKVNRILLNSRNERQKEARFVGATTTKEKAKALREMRGIYLQKMKAAGLDTGKATAEDFAKLAGDLSTKITKANQKVAAANLACLGLQKDINELQKLTNLTDSEKAEKLKALANSLKEQTSLLEDAKKELGEHLEQNELVKTYMDKLGIGSFSGVSERKKEGVRYLRGKIVGSDMTTGFNTSKYVLTSATVAARLAGSVGDSLTVKAISQLEQKGIVSAESYLGEAKRYAEFRKDDRKAKRNAKKSSKENKDAMSNYKAERRNKKTQLNQDRLNRRNRASEGAAKRFENLAEKSTGKTADKYNKKAARQRDKIEKRTRKAGRGTVKDRLNKRLSMYDKRLAGRFGKYYSSPKNWIRNKFNGALGKLKAAKERILNSKIVKFFSGVTNFFDRFINNIKKAILNKLIIPIGGFFLFCVIFLGILDIITISTYFIADNIPATNFAGKLDSVNYIQLIVDDTSKNLTKSYMEIAQKDAQRQALLLSLDENKNNIFISKGTKADGTTYNYAWYKGINLGYIKSIIDSSKSNSGNTLRGINENLLPIVSAMHYRYTDEINYESWLTAKAYCYWLWVETHNVSFDGYTFIEENPCTDIYKTGINEINGLEYGGEITYYEDTHTVIRPGNQETLCNNVYIHGYDMALGLEANAKKAENAENMNKALTFLGLESLSNNTAGVFVDEIPHSPSITGDNCDNYIRKQYGSAPTAENLNCGYYQDSHKHTAACYELTCGKDNHVHSAGNCSCDIEEHIHDTSSPCFEGIEYWCSGCGSGPHSSGTFEHNPGQWHCVYGSPKYKDCGKVHRHSSDCCNKGHTHTSAPPSSYVCEDLEGTTKDSYYSDCWTCTCGLKQHTHAGYTDPIHPGCWKQAYICKGHCGGHITPCVDIVVDMTFEKIVSYDDFKTTHWLSASDFQLSGASEDNLSSSESTGVMNALYLEANAMNDLSKWKDMWRVKMADWFSFWPRSAEGIAETISRAFLYNGAKLCDLVTGHIKALLTGQTYEEIQANIANDYQKKMEEMANQYDIFNFTGWFITDEDDEFVLDGYGNKQLKQEDIDLLKDLYGNWQEDGNYDVGVANWESFEVYFPANSIRPLSQEQIDSIMKTLNITNEKRSAVVRQALDYVGDFWYDLRFPQDGDATGGRIDCSGFVSSVLYHAIGWPNDWTSMTFAQNGDKYGSVGYLSPGDVLAKSDTASYNLSSGWTGGMSNHVIIYIGYLPNGIENHPDFAGVGGYYIVDCSSSAGGSAIKCFEKRSDFDKYPFRYNACFN